MKFKIFGGLDCPDPVLAQLSVLCNTDIVTQGALAALTEHVAHLLLSREMTPAERKEETRRLYDGAISAIEEVVGGSSVPDKLEGFGQKAIAVSEAQRLQRAKQAAAAARRFAPASTSDALPTVKDLDLSQKVALVENYLSQCLVALDTIIGNLIRFGISEDTAMTELTMLGMAPEAVEVVLKSLSDAAASLLPPDQEGAKSALASLSELAAGRSPCIGRSIASHHTEAPITVSHVVRTSVMAAVQEVIANGGSPAEITETINAVKNAAEPNADGSVSGGVLTLHAAVNIDGRTKCTTPAPVQDVYITAAQARVLLNELLLAREVMRGDTNEDQTE